MVSKFTLNTNKTASNAANAAITRTLEIANNYAGELSIEVLPLDKIELDPDNNRDLALTLSDAMNGISPDDPQFEKKNRDWKSLESLAKTIQDGQLINPIFVYRFGNKCRLIAGERRTLASAIAGKKEIIARISGTRPAGSKLRVLQWIENNERQDLSLSERIMSLEAIIDAYLLENPTKNTGKITAALLSELTGMSLTQSKRYNVILQSRESIKNAVLEGKIENIKLVELISSEENETNQDLLLQAAMSGQSFDKIVLLKQELQSGKKPLHKTFSSKKEGVPLGKVSVPVIRMLFDSLLSSALFEIDTMNKINQIVAQVKWHDSHAVSRAFKQVSVLLEKENRILV